MTAPANPLICEECKLTLDNSDEVIVGERPQGVHDRPRKSFWHKACWTRDEQGAREIDRGRLEAVIRRQFV